MHGEMIIAVAIAMCTILFPALYLGIKSTRKILAANKAVKSR